MNPRPGPGRLLLIATLLLPASAWPEAPDENGSTGDAEQRSAAAADPGDDSGPGNESGSESGNPDAPPAGEVPAQTADDEPSAEPDPEDSGGGSDDVFVPTEKVSEDLSVAFPVDI